MMSYLIDAAAERLKALLNVQEFSIQAAIEAGPPPTSPDLYVAIHEAGFTNDRPESDALAMRLRFRATISVRCPEFTFDRQEDIMSDQYRNILRIAEKIGWQLHAERWNVLAMANDRRPQNMNGIAEPYGLIDLGETTKRNGLWWGLGEGGDGFAGFSRSVLFGGALWQADQDVEPEPEDYLE